LQKQDLSHLWRWKEKLADELREPSNILILALNSFPNTQMKIKSKEASWHLKSKNERKEQRR
jgi:hypothetical protein